eukprot:6214611-Pleurochrysis_carterae.AAC.3
MNGDNDSVERARGQVGQFDGQFKNVVHARHDHFSHRSHQRFFCQTCALIEKQLRHTHLDCCTCMIDGARKSSKKWPTSRQYSYHGECIASNVCKRPASSPFGFSYMLCSTTWQACTSKSTFCFLRNATAAKVQDCFQTFLAGNHHHLSGRAVIWVTKTTANY